MACEHARFGRATEAIQELEHLLKMGSRDAIAKVAKAHVDSDFDPIRKNPTFSGMMAMFEPDPDKLILKQLCASPGKIVRMVDPKRGLVIHDSYSDGSDEDNSFFALQLKGNKARRAALTTISPDSSWCNRRDLERGDHIEVIHDSVLSKWKSKRVRCIRASYMRFQLNRLCFYRTEEGPWRLGLIGEFTSGSDPGMRKDNQRGLKKAKKIFGI